MERIAVIGAGAWGTALAVTLVRAGRRPLLWAREPEVAEEINRRHSNARFLPRISLPDAVGATAALDYAAAADAMLLAVPAQHLRGVCARLRPLWRDGLPAVICAKGIESASLARMSEVAAAELPDAVVAILSGPTFAAEVARGLPTAVTLACADAAAGRALVAVIGCPTFRPYLTDDLVGVELGGAVKNVLAIGCGIVEGRGLGDNARAALIARGLAELIRLAVALGGRPETCMGLAGLGDLVLTAASRQSRNYSLGVALGQGAELADALAAARGVVEGVDSAAAVAGLAARAGVEMPICAAVTAMLSGRVALDEAIGGLLARPFRAEVGSVTG